MSSFGELLGTIIFWVIVGGGLLSLILAFILKGSLRKTISVIICLLCVILILVITNNRKTDYNKSQLGHVGTYYLTSYPNCDSCVAVLKNDHTYDIKKNNMILESGNWNFESGSDYLIVYLNNNKDQLGYGRFQFDRFKDTNNIIYNSPLTPRDLENKRHKE